MAKSSPSARGSHLADEALDVLVVEDDPVALLFLSELLSKRGHRVDSLEDGSRAVELYEEKRHALVFLDRQLPDADGIDICREIRALPDAQDSIILFITGSETQESLDEAIQAGADDYVIKPVGPDLLNTRAAIAERRYAQVRALRRASYKDTLTGLGNSHMLEDQLERAMKRFERTGSTNFAVLVLDIDGFHGINQELGRERGDDVLRAVGGVIDRCLRDEDTPARIAVDEFGALLGDLEDESDPIRVAGRIREELTRPVDLGDQKVHVSLSIGIAMPAPETESGDALIRDARKALDRAKSRGRGEIQIYDPAVHARGLARVAMEEEIRDGLANEEFTLNYQPILELETGRIHAFEALMRWKRPSGDFTSPGIFIPVAEQSGLIAPLGWWALEAACRQAQRWRETHRIDPPVQISVNVSSHQFLQPDIADVVDRTLRRTGLPSDGLHLELTETAVMDDADVAVATMAELRGLGCRLHVDDFGTGYSSLAYLCRLPIDTLKVDQAFVRAMMESPENEEVVRTIVRLAKNLGLSVVAEGVETEEQEAKLREMECDYVQGFRYFRPMDPDSADAILADGGAS